MALAGSAGLAFRLPAALSQEAAGSFPLLADLVEFRRLVAANRILANESVVDAFGHISVRVPRNPERFVMSRSRSPALVEHADLMDFDLQVNANVLLQAGALGMPQGLSDAEIRLATRNQNPACKAQNCAGARMG